MADIDPEVPESPATWENVVVGKAKQALGHALAEEDMTEEGEEQEAVAHAVRDVFDAEQEH